MQIENNFYAIYSRKSKFTGKGESIGNQVELCKDYLKTHYNNVWEKQILVYEDEGFSGKNMARPALQQLMKDIEKKKIKAVIVYRLDRISRNINDFSGLIEKLGRLNIDFISIREQFDTFTPMGRAMMYIASVFSQLERETTAERIRDNMHELAKSGRWLGGNTPTGYTSESVETITIDGKKKKSCKLKVLPEESSIIKEIFSLYKKTDSQTMTETELMKKGLKTKTGIYYSRYSIKAILQNPVYAIADEDTYHYMVDQNTALFSNKEEFDGVHGLMVYNRTDQNGKTTIYKPMEEWIVSVGKHQGLISGKDWVAVQKSLERNKVKSYHKPRKNEALLTGLIYCNCGERMYPKLTARKNTEGDGIYTYYCKMKERSKGSVCRQKNINGNMLDRAVLEQIKALAEEESIMMDQMNQMRKFYITHNENDLSAQIETVKREIIKLEKKAESLIDSLVFVEDGVVKTQLVKQIEKTDHEIKEKEKMIKELVEFCKNNETNDLEVDLLAHRLISFKSCIDDMSVEEKRKTIRSIIKKVVWDGKEVHVYF